MEKLELLIDIIFTILLGWYLITNLQWYNYKLDRVILKHHKIQWHIIYFVIPIILYYTLNIIYFSIIFIIYTIGLSMWYKKLDKKLVLTSRVKRFIFILIFINITILVLCFLSQNCRYGVILPLLLTWITTTILEKIFFISYKHQAKKRLKSIKNLQIIAITASFGKTSIKNYLYEVLNKKFNTYMTPRSINTIGGIVKDVNDNLPLNTQIYIVEAGARQQGDIEQIADFLDHQYAIIGSIGEQHIEYFKTLDNIIYTKMEILKSKKLSFAYIHNSVPIKDYDTILKFPDNLKIIKNDLEGIIFEIKIDNTIEQFSSNILGSFNTINLTAVILMAYKLGMSIEQIKMVLKKIQPVKHRLQLSIVNEKYILDDSFNGNLEGMLEAINISSTYKKRKVIITPGLVESTEKANIILAKAIDKVFDVVIITGSLNKEILQSNIKSVKPIILEDKNDMEKILLQYTLKDDLILFANDAPNFI